LNAVYISFEEGCLSTTNAEEVKVADHCIL